MSIILASFMLVSLAACTLETKEYGYETDQTTNSTGDVVDQGYQNVAFEGGMIDTSVLLSNLREQFDDRERLDFQESMLRVSPDQEFYVDLAFCVRRDTDFTYLTEVFGVFKCDSLDQDRAVSANWRYETNAHNPEIEEGYTRLFIRPGTIPTGRVWGSYVEVYVWDWENRVILPDSGEFYLHEASMGDTWGFLSHFYLALKVDPETAEVLDRPIVTIFTIDNALEAPQSEFFVTEDGFGGFRWEAVDGADYYVILTTGLREGSPFNIMHPIASTTDTYWIHPKNTEANRNVLMNTKLNGFGISDDLRIGTDPDGYWPEMRFYNFSVIAVNSETYSALGPIHRGEDIGARLPRTLAYTTIRNEAGEGATMLWAPAIGVLPTYRAIVMCNGSIVHRRIVYDFDAAWLENERSIRASDTEGIADLRIPFVIEGTVFNDTMNVRNVNLETFEQELEAFRQQLDDSAPRGGGTLGDFFTDNVTESNDDDNGINNEDDISQPSADDTIESTADGQNDNDDVVNDRVTNDRAANDEDGENDLPTGVAPTEIPDMTGDRIFAHSALSAYFALNLMAANEAIDLSGFPEITNWNNLTDAFFEALYQNPLALHVNSVSMEAGSSILLVEYRESASTIHRQQNAIRQIVPEIIADIITADMTDLEITFAINNFLVDTTDYDYAALENAEQNNFKYVDSRYNDSFTAYGILINRVGVCAGYAAAFRLLADEAGLESIVVTGYLEGFLPHAWNRVNIDGQWHTVDVTNNANEYLQNAILNLPDNKAQRILIEDRKFVLDAYLGNFRSNDGSNEYFRVTERFFEADEIAAEIARGITEEGSVTLRTTHDLDEELFFEIAQEVMDILNVDNIFGFHWIGVIWMGL